MYRQRAHARVKLVVAVSAPVDRLPLRACDPLQPPDAVHRVAFVELHVSVADPPLATASGLTLKVTVGSPYAFAVSTAASSTGTRISEVQPHVRLAATATIPARRSLAIGEV
jgi:hypothetical protein